MNLLIISFISLLAGAATGAGGILGVLFKPGERSLVLGLGFSSEIMLGVTFLMLVLESDDTCTGRIFGPDYLVCMEVA